jgi:hypothetical protein
MGFAFARRHLRRKNKNGILRIVFAEFYDRFFYDRLRKYFFARRPLRRKNENKILRIVFAEFYDRIFYDRLRKIFFCSQTVCAEK